MQYAHKESTIKNVFGFTYRAIFCPFCKCYWLLILCAFKWPCSLHEFLLLNNFSGLFDFCNRFGIDPDMYLVSVCVMIFLHFLNFRVFRFYGIRLKICGKDDHHALRTVSWALVYSIYVMILSSSASTNIYLPSYFLLNHGFGETKSLGNAFNLYATTFFDCNIFAYPWPFRSRLITSKELWVG